MIISSCQSKISASRSTKSKVVSIGVVQNWTNLVWHGWGLVVNPLIDKSYLSPSSFIITTRATLNNTILCMCGMSRIGLAPTVCVSPRAFSLWHPKIRFLWHYSGQFGVNHLPQCISNLQIEFATGGDINHGEISWTNVEYTIRGQVSTPDSLVLLIIQTESVR